MFRFYWGNIDESYTVPDKFYKTVTYTFSLHCLKSYYVFTLGGYGFGSGFFYSYTGFY